MGNRELLAVVLALQEWRHWLEGAEHIFIIWTDHKNLEHLRIAKRLNPRQARWALFLERFRFTLTYRPGSRNVKPDALSRLKERRRSRTRPTFFPLTVLVANDCQRYKEFCVCMSYLCSWQVHPSLPEGSLAATGDPEPPVVPHRTGLRDGSAIVGR